jgi:hypothetical protein
MPEVLDRLPFDAERFLAHGALTAGLLEEPFDAPTSRRVLAAFAPELQGCVLQWKATSRQGDGLYYRFLGGIDGSDHLARARDAGLLAIDGPALQIHREILEAFPNARRAGLDFHAARGLAKAWTYTSPVPTEAVLALDHVPAAARAAGEFMARHGLAYVGFVASDYLAGTFNLYCRWEDGDRHPAWLERLVADTGGGELPARRIQDILETQAGLGGIALTFRWDRPGIQRWCVYSLEVPVLAPALHPRLAALRDHAPSLNEDPSYHMGWSYGPAGFYQKLEKNYAKDARHFLTTVMGVDLTRPTPKLNPSLGRSEGTDPDTGRVCVVPCSR